MKLSRQLFLVIALALVTAGCGSPTSPTGTAPFSATDLIVGTGTEATVGDFVAVNYTGWLYSATAPENKGAQFDTSVGRGPFPFTIGERGVIQGWSQGVQGMRVGGKRRLVIPPELAYGEDGTGGIPPNATLVFDIDLLAVQE